MPFCATRIQLGFCHGGGRSAAIASGKRLLDLAAHARTPRFIDNGFGMSALCLKRTLTDQGGGKRRG
jgi:hypothetical protein